MSKRFINNFEQTAADTGISNGYDYVVCSHIHQPEMRRISNAQGSMLYLNSGDWTENLTALECNAGKWQLFRFADSGIVAGKEEEAADPNASQLFNNMLEEFKLLKTE